ncbi:ATP-dependent RNA helicase MAK5, putative [Plasmodium ovale]|uniref:ATP-dependent RNA helicase n=1 Tax=Plasmodium ovale TaxID=36330 RepID=A0A1D3TLI8_PLAOA|nr:ATP-dependent RNA helicase MAK5, putative [Plasmodium ovale]
MLLHWDIHDYMRPFTTILPSTCSLLRKEGLISIERADSRNVKILSKEDLTNKNGDEITNCTKEKRKVNQKKEKNGKILTLKQKKEKKSPHTNETVSEKDESRKVGKKAINKRKKQGNKEEKSVPGVQKSGNRKKEGSASDRPKRKRNRNRNRNSSRNRDRKRKHEDEGKGKHEDMRKRNSNPAEGRAERQETKTGAEEGKSKKRPYQRNKNSNIDNLKKTGVKGREWENEIVDSKKKEKFDVNAFIKNEEDFKKIDQIKYKIVCKRWNRNNTVNLLHSIMKSLYDREFFVPREIQTKTLEDSINLKKDIIVVSKTGTGKTLTFCIPILNNIVINKLKEYKKKKKNIHKFRCLILVPTRELAIQILKHFNYINSYIHIYITTIIGGLNVNKQRRIISKKPEIIICTPGRLKYFLKLEDKINYVYNMKHVRYFACDEVDKMIETSFIQDIHFISKHLYNCVGNKKKFIQTFFLSATLGLTVQLRNENLTKLLNYVTIRKEKSCIVNLCDHNIDKDYNDGKVNILPDELILNIVKKLHKLFYLLKIRLFDESNETISNKERGKHRNINKVIIFVNTIKDVKEFSTVFRFLYFDKSLESCIPKKYRSNLSVQNNVNIYAMHSKQNLKERMQNVSKFSQPNNKAILFCTDVLSRGIDLDKCDMIVQLNCPIADITFVHRSGRTARNFRIGECICFITDDEASSWIKSLNKIGINLEDLNEYEPLKNLGDADHSKINRAIACCDEITLLQKKLKDNKKESFLSRLAREADLDDEEESSSDSDNPSEKQTNEQIFSQLLRLKKQLYSILYRN